MAFNLRKIDLSTIFVCYFLHVRSSVGWDLVEEMMDLSEEEIFAKAQEEGVDKMEEDEEDEEVDDIA